MTHPADTPSHLRLRPDASPGPGPGSPPNPASASDRGSALEALLRGAVIDHVGIAVADLEAAIDFHTRILGGRLGHREVNSEQGVEEAMIVYGSEGAAQVQLLAPLTADSAIGKFLDRSGPGLQQLAFRVDDVESTAGALRAAGLRLLYPQARRGTGGSLINFVHPKDAGGVLVELVQAPSTDNFPT